MEEKEAQILADRAIIESHGGAMVVARIIAGPKAKEVEVVKAWQRVSKWKERGIPKMVKLAYPVLQKPARKGGKK